MLHRKEDAWKENIERPKIRVSPHGRVCRKHAAIILGRSQKTLENWASLGKGPSVTMIGGRAFYDYEELVAWRGHDDSTAHP
jgi:hypothetical protein